MSIVTFDNKILLQKSEVIKDIDGKIHKLASEMFKTLYMANGLGLAAVQIGELKRLFVMDVPDFGKYEMINPVIIDKSLETSRREEGCLSLPGIAAEVTRSKEITVEYYDLEGEIKKLKAKGLLATCIQHELDHLEGILFVDRLALEEKLEKLNEFRKLYIV